MNNIEKGEGPLYFVCSFSVGYTPPPPRPVHIKTDHIASMTKYVLDWDICMSPQCPHSKVKMACIGTGKYNIPYTCLINSA
jgi:hypothetical protein